MAAFDEVLKQLREWDGGEDHSPPPSNLFDDLARGYRELVDQRDGASVVIAQKDKELAETKSEVSRLKGENYDLASQLGFKSPQEDPEPEQPTGIFGLFERRK